MVLTTSELIASLRNEVRILLHLAGKIEPAMLDYRPTPGQRSTLELLQYLSMMGPALLDAARTGTFDTAAWTAAASAAASRGFGESVAAIAALADRYAAVLGEMSDADFRAEVELFGHTTSRGAFLVNNVLSGCAAYRTQLFLYLKACGREELGTMNLWAGTDAPAQGPSKDDVRLGIRQFAGAWRVLCADGPAFASADTDGLTYVFSGVPIGFFNIALLTAEGVRADRLAARALEACGWAETRSVPWMFIVTHERLEQGLDPAAALEACGLVPVMPLTGMLAPRVAPATRVPEGLELTSPADDAGCVALVHVNARAYGMDLDAAEALIGRKAFWTNHTATLGLAGGEAACAAAVMVVDGYRYVALVATDPGRQRRGFADAAMRHALEASARLHGELPSVLHATDAGRPVYERMGYTPISTHTVFMERRWLEGH